MKKKINLIHTLLSKIWAKYEGRMKKTIESAKDRDFTKKSKVTIEMIKNVDLEKTSELKFP